MVSSAALEKSETLQSRIERLPQGGFEVGTKPDKCPEEWTLLRFRDVYRLRLNTDSPVHIWADGQTLLSEITENLYTSNAEWQTAFKRSEWKRIVFHCFADVVAETNSVKTIPPNEFYRTLRGRIKNEAEAPAKPRTHLFGCHLSMLPDFPALPPIGPVTFEKRLDWVARAQGDDRLDPGDAATLSDHWQNRQSGDSSPTESAKGIMKTVGDADFVCSVTITRRMGQDAGHAVALMAARLALATISLGFHTPSRALRAMRLTWDGGLYQQVSVTSCCQSTDWDLRTAGKCFPGGIGTGVSSQEWSKLCQDDNQGFRAAGRAIDWSVDRNACATTDHPQMAAALYHALLWFHEGCRQELDPMALANFMTSLDALAKKHNKSGVLKLAEARLSEKSYKAFKNEIGNLYGNGGRSQILHGVNKRLGYDWTQDRALAEQLARVCLLECLEVFAKHTGDDDPGIFTTAARSGAPNRPPGD